jgi:hypothetical protein
LVAVKTPVEFTAEELSDLVAAADASVLPHFGGVRFLIFEPVPKIHSDQVTVQLQLVAITKAARHKLNVS